MLCGLVLKIFWLCILQGQQVAVGTHKGHVQIWDVAVNKKITTLEGHGARVGESLA